MSLPIWSRFDWKYFITLVVAIAALYPAWLSYFQTPASAIDVELVSQSALQPVAKDKTLGLEMTIDKVPVIDPYLSVLQFINTGNKPVLSKDFESPLEITIDGNKKILRIEVTESSPKELKPTLDINNNKIRLQPILLNPNDTITLAVLSSNGLPMFTPTARIAGVESIKLSQQEKEDKNTYLTPGLIFLVFLTTITANAAVWRLEFKQERLVTFNRRTAILFNIVLFYLCLFLNQILAMRLGYDTAWYGLLLYGVASIITLPFCIWLEKRDAAEIENGPMGT